jgi:hypothetical protein
MSIIIKKDDEAIQTFFADPIAKALGIYYDIYQDYIPSEIANIFMAVKEAMDAVGINIITLKGFHISNNKLTFEFREAIMANRTLYIEFTNDSYDIIKDIHLCLKSVNIL